MSKRKEVRRRRTKPGEIPQILHHKPRNLVFILIEGRRFYLGPYGSPEAEKNRLRVWTEFSLKSRVISLNRTVGLIGLLQ